MPGPSILVTFAVAEEARPFRDRLASRPDVETLLTGIGAGQARKTFLARIQHGPPRLVITAGFAGGLNPALQKGDLAYDVSLAPQLDIPLRDAGASPVRFLCSPSVLVSPEAKTNARQATGTDAVEMESGILQDLCREHHIPCAVVRVISDTAEERLPLDFNTCVRPNGRLRWGVVARHCLRHPSVVADLLRLRTTSQTAANRLAEALLRIIPP